MAGQRWRWTAEVVQTPIDSVKRIDVAVRLVEADEQSQLSIVTGFFGDKIGKPGVLIAQFTPPPPGPSTNPATNPIPQPPPSIPGVPPATQPTNPLPNPPVPIK
jgi:hypothetical protein